MPCEAIIEKPFWLCARPDALLFPLAPDRHDKPRLQRCRPAQRGIPLRDDRWVRSIEVALFGFRIRQIDQPLPCRTAWGDTAILVGRWELYALKVQNCIDRPLVEISN